MITKKNEEFSNLDKLLYPALCKLNSLNTIPIKFSDSIKYEKADLYFNLDDLKYKVVYGASLDEETYEQIKLENNRLHQIKLGERILSNNDEVLFYTDTKVLLLNTNNFVKEIISITRMEILRLINPESNKDKLNWILFNIKNRFEFGNNIYTTDVVSNSYQIKDVVNQFLKITDTTDSKLFVEHINQYINFVKTEYCKHAQQAYILMIIEPLVEILNKVDL